MTLGFDGCARRGMDPTAGPGSKRRRPVTTLARHIALATILAMGLFTVPGIAQEQTSPAADTGAQSDELRGRVDGMNEQLQVLQTDTDKLKKFKFSGYIQARWETSENKSDTVRV